MAFIHVPKAAGRLIRDCIKSSFSEEESWVEGWGTDGGLDRAHLFPDELRMCYPRVAEMLEEEDCLSFTVVRHPIARAVSAFQHSCGGYADEKERSRGLAGYLERIESGYFKTDGRDGFRYIHGAPQHEFLLIEDECLVKQILRLEDDDFSDRISAILGREIVLYRPNIGFGHYLVQPSSEDVETIQRIYARDFEQLGYVVGDPR
ncbi:MAG: sulfotransferase family 2 domain-containing protein [Luteolibacter sp.]|uniref:sulfotransferase family 2 domain-containing protein n=1 Tax=Luteolibacter sp. TaxID=1962973 RepID=UPI0032651289